MVLGALVALLQKSFPIAGAGWPALHPLEAEWWATEAQPNVLGVCRPRRLTCSHHMPRRKKLKWMRGPWEKEKTAACGLKRFGVTHMILFGRLGFVVCEEASTLADTQQHTVFTFTRPLRSFADDDARQTSRPTQRQRSSMSGRLALVPIGVGKAERTVLPLSLIHI